jgi:hypothetical protein
MTEIDKVIEALDTFAPREVHIGTDSPSDRVLWAKLRLDALKRTVAALRLENEALHREYNLTSEELLRLRS